MSPQEASGDDDESDVEVRDELIEAACRMLAVEPQPDDLASRLRAAMRDYLIDLSVREYWGTPKEQRIAFRRLSKSLRRALIEMLAIAPEYGVALDALLEKKSRECYPSGLFLDAQRVLVDLLDAVIRFDEEYRPKQGRRTDIELETVVRKLIDIVEPLTGEFPTVRLNKHNDVSPTLKSDGARAIGLLIRGVDPSRDERTIVNMIEKVRGNPWGSDSHLEALFSLDPDAALDASLLSNPRGV